MKDLVKALGLVLALVLVLGRELDLAFVQELGLGWDPGMALALVPMMVLA